MQGTTMRRAGSVMADVGEHRWWIEWLPWLWGAMVSAVTVIGGLVTWIVRDRIAIQRMLDDHENKLTRLISESDEWDGGHTHDRNIRDVSSQLATIAVEMRGDIRAAKERMDSWFSWSDHGGRRETK